MFKLTYQTGLQSLRVCVPSNITNHKFSTLNKIKKQKKMKERNKERERVGDIYLFTDTDIGVFVHQLVE